MSQRASWALLVVMGLGASGCGSRPGSDPCAPHGHIHRSSSEGDWCHCERGYLAAEEQLACVVDPNYQEPGPFDFGGAQNRACWHAVQGPFAQVDVGRNGAAVNDFKTVYVVRLNETNGVFRGEVQFKPWGTGRFALLVDTEAPVAVYDGLLAVPVEATSNVTACTEFSRQLGFELVNKVTYRVDLGPSASPEIRLMLEEVP